MNGSRLTAARLVLLAILVLAMGCPGTRDSTPLDSAPRDPDASSDFKQRDMRAKDLQRSDTRKKPADSAAHDQAKPKDQAAKSCVGAYAYLHGDLWPLWYNMRMCCDGEHRALWRCERKNGVGAAACAALKSHYTSCLNSPNSSVCPNWGVCCFKGSNGCPEPTAEYLKICDTRAIQYNDPTVWGTYYGRQWGSGTTLHRFMTLHVWDAKGTRIISFSSNPGESDAYMDSQNYGVGSAPQGHIQIIKDKYKDRFGTFACIRLPAGSPLTLQAIWMNDFCHTCKSSYWSYPNTPCRTAKLTLTPKAGVHYLWSDSGLTPLAGCSGPPSDISKWLPAAACSTGS